MAAHQPISVRTYVTIYVILLCLTALTVYIATQGHLGVWEIPVALGIATAKTILVGLFFMHLIHTDRLTWLVIGAGVLFLAVMIVLTGLDYWTRDWLPVRAYPQTVSPPR
ncbi:MAG: cytochrome C oxidase subunit IV family protein [Gemmataceae bacterium]